MAMTANGSLVGSAYVCMSRGARMRMVFSAMRRRVRPSSRVRARGSRSGREIKRGGVHPRAERRAALTSHWQGRWTSTISPLWTAPSASRNSKAERSTPQLPRSSQS